ncbi:hypothetical protein VCRA2126O85_20122 [Vibrio crassostreae]|nr:hypothetical protein VCRA2126O86_20122 [Vibrio crassostreae]CAK2832258.1 hypothetical protein VCRA2127O91_20124 [Vibrio crassostreae]CAK2837173.1 hypothetical protein VCRA2126O85_20122 [Vibrio crassostreae]CAK2838918.1 hypothetical protein VCRA2125O83_20126 [Vibrio crassostreae]CAK2924419.1 hypothetical protein VCRA2128O100_30155 [Vibrio crassostreae]
MHEFEFSNLLRLSAVEYTSAVFCIGSITCWALLAVELISPVSFTVSITLELSDIVETLSMLRVAFPTSANPPMIDKATAIAPPPINTFFILHPLNANSYIRQNNSTLCP